MIEVNLLGTGGMMPLPDRFLTSLLIKYKGSSILIDCGEGTQVSIREKHLGFKQIDYICITHFHADHISGLPGILLTIGNSGRTDTLNIIGPKGIDQVVNSLRIIAPELPYDINFIEIDQNGYVSKLHDLSIEAVSVEHNLPCYGYIFELKRAGKFNAQKANDLGVPLKLWSVLQSGNSVEYNGKIVTASEVLGESRQGIKICYATDLRPSIDLVKHAKKSDLFICEGNYGDPDKLSKAEEHKHCLFSEAAQMAKDAEVKELWLTHFSPSMSNPYDYLENATNIFEATFIDKNSTVIKFDQDKK